MIYMNIRLVALFVILLVSVLLLVSSLDRLNFGLDIQGGKVFLFGSEKNETESIVQVISKRVESFRLQETRAYVSNGNVAIVSLTDENLNILLIHGIFEARILQQVNFENNTGQIKIGTNIYPIELADNKIKINGSSYGANQSFSLEDIEFNLLNLSNNSAAIEATIFKNEDVVSVLSSYSSITFDSSLQRYEFSTPLQISSQASKRFMAVAQGLNTTFVGTQQTLEGFLTYYLDENQISKLNIPFEMSLRELTNIAVVGFGKNQSSVSDEQNIVQAVLQSGSLPELNLVGTENYVPKFKEIAIEISLISALVIIVLSIGLTFFRYRKFKLSIYPIAIIFSEILSITGAIALTQHFFAYGWLINLQTIFGMIVFSIISYVMLFFITEYRIKKKELNLQYKCKKIISLKTLLTIVILAISLPLIFTAWKGFGLVLFSGLVLGFLITKPFYEEIITKKFL